MREGEEADEKMGAIFFYFLTVFFCSAAINSSSISPTDGAKLARPSAGIAEVQRGDRAKICVGPRRFWCISCAGNCANLRSGAEAMEIVLPIMAVYGCM